MTVLPRRLRFRQTTLLISLCIGFVIGIGLARRVELRTFVPAFVFLVAAIVLWRRKSPLAFVVFVTLGLAAGLWRGSFFMEEVHAYESLMKRPVILEVTANSDAVYGSNSQLSFTAGSVRVTDPENIQLAGNIRVEGFGVPMVYKGDIVQVEGKLFPTRGSNQARISYAQLETVGSVGSWVDTLRRNFVAGLQSALPDPESSFGAGLLIGQRSTLPQQTADQLAATGLTHLVAVSGYNLTIIIAATRGMFGKRSKYQGAVLSLSLIVLFLLMTGLSASIVRAALVSSMSLLAWYYGRAFRPLLLITLPAAITAAWNPFYVWSDIGWYLSFSAFFGVLVVAPLIVKRFSPNKEPRMVTMVVIETFAAQLMTLPLIMYIFGRISIIGLVANILVVPLVPLAMLVTLLAGIAGMLVPALSGWIAWPAKILLTYMLDIAALLSRFPHAAVERVISLSYMIALYVAILVVAFLLWRKVTRKTTANMVE